MEVKSDGIGGWPEAKSRSPSAWPAVATAQI
ncbi:hypothetical protein OPIT5_17260 [Opitutaceae bacterium TAV5]|nr:hypothetical protein OPIT5_17260 [Opitutaceae bacterium TAV5]